MLVLGPFGSRSISALPPMQSVNPTVQPMAAKKAHDPSLCDSAGARNLPDVPHPTPVNP